MNAVLTRIPNTYGLYQLSGLTAVEIENLAGVPSKPLFSNHAYAWNFKVDGHSCCVWDRDGRHEENIFIAHGIESCLVKTFGAEVR
jgi:hypothetical protein